MGETAEKTTAVLLAFCLLCTFLTTAAVGEDSFFAAISLKRVTEGELYYGDQFTISAVISSANMNCSVAWERQTDERWEQAAQGERYTFTLNDGTARRNLRAVLYGENGETVTSSVFAMPAVNPMTREEKRAAEEAARMNAEEAAQCSAADDIPMAEVVPGTAEPINERTAEPEYAEPVYTEPEYTEPVNEEPEYTEPVYAETEYAEPEYTEPVNEEPEYAESEYTEPVYAEPVNEDPEYMEPEYTESVYVEPEYTEPEHVEPDEENTDWAEEPENGNAE